MNFLSVCSGIEAVSVATKSMGWKPLAFSEIEPFPSAVLAHHYPGIPNLGDMTKHKDWRFNERLDLLVGGCPCQAFSVAGSRRSLDDERGNLTLTFCNIADQFDPKFVWFENVPGILNTHDNAFGCLLAGLAGLDEVLRSADGKWRGSGMVVGRRRRVAWVTLDAQFAGVPQRRRRIFVLAVDAQSVADSPALCPSKILSIGTSLRRDTPTRRKTGESITHSVAPSLTSSGREVERAGETRGQMVCFANAGHFGAMQTVDVADPLRAKGGDPGNGGETVTIMAHGQANAEIRSDGGSPSLTCNHEAPIIAFNSNAQVDQMKFHEELNDTLTTSQYPAVAYTPDLARSLTARHDSSPCADRGMDVVTGCFSAGQSPTAGSIAYHEEESPTLRGGASGTNMTPTLLHKMQVRRLTPEECEILMGFPVGYTDIKLKGKPTPDGARYKSLGNSMCTSVMRYIGERIQDAVKL